MKNIKPYIIATAMALGCFILIIQLVKKSRQLTELKNVKQIVDNQVQIEAKEISRKVDSSGLETVIYDINHTKASLSQLALNRKTKGIIDTTALALDLRTKQLKQIMVLKTSLEAENLRLKKQMDASNMPYYTYDDNGLKLKFTPPNANDTSARADFTANVQIKATQFWRRNWILGPKESFIAITSSNPAFKINNVDYLEVEQKQPAFKLRIQASSSYELESGMFTYGPAAQVDLGRLSFKGHYGKSLMDNKWKTQLSASYDLINF